LGRQGASLLPAFVFWYRREEKEKLKKKIGVVGVGVVGGYIGAHLSRAGENVTLLA